MFTCFGNDLVEDILMVVDKKGRSGKAVIMRKYKGMGSSDQKVASDRITI